LSASLVDSAVRCWADAIPTGSGFISGSPQARRLLIHGLGDRVDRLRNPLNVGVRRPQCVVRLWEQKALAAELQVLIDQNVSDDTTLYRTATAALSHYSTETRCLPSRCSDEIERIPS
jgi:hypothetical protein